MFDTGDHESHQSLSDFRQARDIFLPPISNAVGTILTQESRKRKLTNVEHDDDIREGFTIKV